MKIPHWKLRCFWSKILAFILFFLFVENFVTPFSTLANIKGSLPTNSTTPDRLRCRTKTDGEDSPDFWVRTSSKKSIFQRSGIYTLQWWSTPQKKPIAGFSWPGSHFSRDKRWPKTDFLGRRACNICICWYSYLYWQYILNYWYSDCIYITNYTYTKY